MSETYLQHGLEEMAEEHHLEETYGFNNTRLKRTQFEFRLVFCDKRSLGGWSLWGLLKDKVFKHRPHTTDGPGGKNRRRNRDHTKICLDARGIRFIISNAC